MQVKTIKEKVAEQISASGPKVEEIIVNTLVSDAISKRVEIIQQSLGRLDTLKKDLRKIDKFDVKTYSGDGAESGSYSEQRYKDIQKAKESISKLESAINEALEKNTEDAYNKLNGLLK